MRIFGFHAPQERIAPEFYKAAVDYSHVNAGAFVRNAVLSGMCYNNSYLAPAYFKTRDAVHDFFGYKDQLGAMSSVYGGCSASADESGAHGILCHQNASAWWTPGGNGVDAWIYAKLPEATLVETYLVGTNSTSCPISWKLQGSLDGSTWSDLHVVESSGQWDATFEAKTFTVPEASRGTYLYYRLYITSSNATTMKLRNLRLFRAVSVCAKGQLLLDANAASPLNLSFAAGFGSDGQTPVDYSAALSAISLSSMFDTDGYPTIHHTPITSPMPVNIYAVRGSNGAVSVEFEDASGDEFIQASGGMNSVEDKGWVCSNYNYEDMRLVFGRATNAGTVFGSNYNTVTATFMYSGNDGVFADKIYASIGGNRYVTWYLYTVEMDNSEITIAGGNSVSVNENISIGRRIKGVRLYYNNSLGGGNSSGYIRTIRILSPCSPSYRYSSGKFYTRETHSDTWTECQKIKIGTCVLGSDGEVYQALPLSATQLQWMTNGNAETFLDA